MLRDWSDEWKNARLSLELRGDELFQGETLSVAIRAVVALDTAPAPSPAQGVDEAVEQVEEQALEKLEARWRRHCDGALVDLKLVEPAPNKPDRIAHLLQQHHQPSAHAPQAPRQPRATLFHQESRVVLLPLRREDASVTAAPTSLRVTLTLRCECTLRVRAEFWQRPLTLIARLTPRSQPEGGADNDVVSSLVQSLPTMLLSEAFKHHHLLPLLREQTTDPPNLTRRVEHRLRLSKLLVLKMETRLANDCRVVILARATNTHASLGVRVLDLQLHVNQLAAADGTRGAAEYRVARSPTDSFPVELAPHEQYNFVFIVEPVATAPPWHASLDAGVQNGSTSQQSLLTLSWETAAEPGSPSMRPLLQPITEHHTILWSPHPHRIAAGVSKGSSAAADLLEFLPKPPPLGLGFPAGAKPPEAVAAMRRGSPSCPLSVTLAPLSESATGGHRVGAVETLCVVVSNRSTDSTDFDLSLVIPPPHSAQRAWLAFETVHHLGRLRPGTIVRKSVRLVFLRHGGADLNALLLFDHTSRTWFLPPSPSSSSAWELFVHP